MASGINHSERKSPSPQREENNPSSQRPYPQQLSKAPELKQVAGTCSSHEAGDTLAGPQQGKCIQQPAENVPPLLKGRSPAEKEQKKGGGLISPEKRDSYAKP